MYTKNSRNRNSYSTKNSYKTIGYIMMIVGIILSVGLTTGFFPLLKHIQLGLFGLSAYIYVLLLLFISRSFIKEAAYVVNKRFIKAIGLAVLSIASVVHIILSNHLFNNNFSLYLSNIYNSQNSVGGVLFSIISYPILRYTHLVAAIVFFLIIFLISISFIIDNFIQSKEYRALKKSPLFNFLKKDKAHRTAPIVRVLTNNRADVSSSNKQSKKIKSEEQNKYNENPENNKKTYEEIFNIKPYTNKEPSKVQDESEYLGTNFKNNNLTQKASNNEGVSIEEATNDKHMDNVSEKFTEELESIRRNKVPESTEKNIFSRDQHQHDSDNKNKETFDRYEDIPDKKNNESNKTNNYNNNNNNNNNNTNDYKDKNLKNNTNKDTNNKKYQYNPPTMDLLNDYDKVSSDIMASSINSKSNQITTILEEYNISTDVVNTTIGPSVTRFEVNKPIGIPVNKIVKYQNDIKLALAVKGDIRIEAPIPGKSTVGIEIPNDVIETVGLKDLLQSKDFKNASSDCTFVIGKNIYGETIFNNLDKTIHMLIAGSTGSGKSVCMNAIIISLIYNNSPEDLKLILIDPKKVEFYVYNNLPHLLVPNVITDPKKAIKSLEYAIKEMNRRYQLFQDNSVVNIKEFNEKPDVIKGKKNKLPRIAIIIDEVANLMNYNKKVVEEKISDLSSLARAAGIHLILATQRPSVDVITGVIKTNLPTKIAFRVPKQVDSRTILDDSGAENLLGQGDMLYMAESASSAIRLQGAFISSDEIHEVVEYVKNNNRNEYCQEASDIINKTKVIPNYTDQNGDKISFDSYVSQILDMAINNNSISVTMVRRKFPIGYSRAANILDQLEEAGFIGPSNGSKPRDVFITREDYEDKFKNVNTDGK